MLIRQIVKTALGRWETAGFKPGVRPVRLQTLSAKLDIWGICRTRMQSYEPHNRLSGRVMAIYYGYSNIDLNRSDDFSSFR